MSRIQKNTSTPYSETEQTNQPHNCFKGSYTETRQHLTIVAFFSALRSWARFMFSHSSLSRFEAFSPRVHGLGFCPSQKSTRVYREHHEFVSIYIMCCPHKIKSVNRFPVFIVAYTDCQHMPYVKNLAKVFCKVIIYSAVCLIV